MKKRFTEEQIIKFLKESDARRPVRRLVADAILQNEAMKEALRKRW